MKVLFHKNCLDGMCAAFTFWYQKHRHMTAEEVNSSFIPITYGEQVPASCLGETVFIFDFSFDRDTLLNLKRQTQALLVIDHHRTAREALADLDFCVFDETECGASLVEFYFQLPKLWITPHVRDRDLWLWKLPGTKEICLVLDTYMTKNVFETFRKWEGLINQPKNIVTSMGTVLADNQVKNVKKAVENVHELLIDGYTFAAVNSGHNVSEICHELLSCGNDYACCYFYSGSKWVYSLRTGGDRDVSAIAKAFPGGGGHQHAAGFSLKEKL